ncbi:MAG: di-trans,poly-cis-decaprenylcistransferase [Chlamydiae bacterium]|nr:di-trans,poly-cis-decaprenylcistransferase [Chlamydiota bacterium]
MVSGVIPRHIAIIMDGNRRWARTRGLSPICGHWKGAEVIFPLVRSAAAMGVEVLTLYTFSTENWTRSEEEIQELMALIVHYLESHAIQMQEESVRLETIGDISKMPSLVQDVLAKTKQMTRGGDKITLVLALNYGSRDEMRRAIVRIVQDVEIGKLNKKEISEDLIASYLDTARFGDPDLFIRTSGELRLSNFLLWQLSYTEVYIAKVLWPDFTSEHLIEAIAAFQKRERRLGGT